MGAEWSTGWRPSRLWIVLVAMLALTVGCAADDETGTGGSAVSTIAGFELAGHKLARRNVVHC